MAQEASDSDHPYIAAARRYVGEGLYPSGWAFFASALAPRVATLSVQLCDISSYVAEQYTEFPTNLQPTNASVAFREIDGYSYLDNVEADLVFLDPPYHPNADADWKALAAACRKLRYRGIPYLAWYPFYWPTKPRRLVEATLETGWEVAWSACGEKPSQNLKGCGMLISRDLVPFMESARKELELIADRLNSIDSIVVRSPGVN